MADVTKTKIVVTSTNSEYNIPGSWSADQIKANYTQTIPGLLNMTSTEDFEDGGATRVLYFSPRTGNKG
jgi:hypothetical protein